MELKYIRPDDLFAQLCEDHQKAEAKAKAKAEAKKAEKAQAKRRAEQQRIEEQAVAERNAQLAEWSYANKKADRLGMSPFKVLDREAKMVNKGLKAKPQVEAKAEKPKPIKKVKAKNSGRKHSKVQNGKRYITLQTKKFENRVVYSEKARVECPEDRLNDLFNTDRKAYYLHMKMVEQRKRQQAEARKKVRTQEQKAASYRKRINKTFAKPAKAGSNVSLPTTFMKLTLEELKALYKKGKENNSFAKISNSSIGYNNGSARKVRNNGRSLSERRKGKTSAKGGNK